MAELCGLRVPAGLAGTSLVPVLRNSAHEGKAFASSFFRHRQHLGITLRTDRFRIVEWIHRSNGQSAQVELHDHAMDPYKTVNVAGSLAYRNPLEDLLDLLRSQGFQPR